MINIVQKWKDKIIALVETKVKLMQLEFIERTSSLLSVFILVIVFILLGFGVFLFIGLGVAEKFSALLDSYIMGYLAAASCYLVLGFIFYLFRKRILSKLSNVFIQVLTEDREEEDDDETPKL